MGRAVYPLPPGSRPSVQAPGGKPGARLYLGRWQDTLESVTDCHLLLSDPPYSERTHKGYKTARDLTIAGVEYAAITPDQCREFADHWLPRVSGWVVLFCDHVSFRTWEEVITAAGWLVFAPVVWWPSSPPPRLQGDGPASAVEYLLIARPRKRPQNMGHRPGRYDARTMHGEGRTGCKDPLALAHILADYSRPGDLVVDPFAGTATVGAACIATGRDYIGSEVDPKTHALGLRRLTSSPRPLPGMGPDRWA